MAKSPPPVRFTATLVRMDSGARHHLVPVPDAIAEVFKAAKVKRVICTLNGQRVRRALQNHADGGSFILVGQPLLAQLQVKAGAALEVQLRADPKPDEVDLPDELELVLAQDDIARARWDTFTAGKRRTLLMYITPAKREETRIKRSVELAEKIRKRIL